ncbi:hypothetical protein Fot_14176 [Forsythia ovata]|uniref:Uncharacterized protein n=1 Tax=Forsythia ovata TaxID=205694 RepID=A0ABD1W7W7_9LAMI
MVSTICEYLTYEHTTDEIEYDVVSHPSIVKRQRKTQKQRGLHRLRCKLNEFKDISVYFQETPYRWHKVAHMILGKSAIDVINQYKILIQLFKLYTIFMQSYNLGTENSNFKVQTRAIPTSLKHNLLVCGVVDDISPPSPVPFAVSVLGVTILQTSETMMDSSSFIFVVPVVTSEAPSASFPTGPAPSFRELKTIR